jgi:hypothetical protein
MEVEDEPSIKDEYVSSVGDAQTDVDAENESQIGTGITSSHRSGKSRIDVEFRPAETSSSRPLSKISSVKNLGRSFDFHTRTRFDATQTILQSRSDSYIIRPPPSDNDIWRRKPPDFRAQDFAPRPPPRNSQYAVKPWLYSTQKDSFYEKGLQEKKEEILLPEIAKPMTQSADWPEFVRRFHIVDSEEARQAFVREGKFSDEPYEPPKPHDFRGVSNGLL